MQKKRSFFLFVLMALSFASVNGFADEVTHQLGNSGYAVREAMLDHADLLSPEYYYSAASWQQRARELFAQRKIKQALAASHTAEQMAKIAIKQSAGKQKNIQTFVRNKNAATGRPQ